MSEIERFMSKVKKDGAGGCWEWMGGRDSWGYGVFGIGSRKDATRKSVGAHRYAYEHFVGEIPDGLQIDHLCKNPACVNPAHLEVVTCRENIRRGTSFSAINARKTHCPRGHTYDEANTYIGSGGNRTCRACGAIRCRVYRTKRGDVGKRNADKTHCPRGHIYDEANTYIDKDGSRHCRACNAIQSYAYKVRRKAERNRNEQ